MNNRIKATQRPQQNAAQIEVYAKLESALTLNTKPVVCEREKTRLWLLQIYGNPPVTGKK